MFDAYRQTNMLVYIAMDYHLYDGSPVAKGWQVQRGAWCTSWHR